MSKTNKKIDMTASLAAQAKQEIDNRRAATAAASASPTIAAPVQPKQVAQAAQTTNSARVITEIQKNKREKIIISINEYSGHKYVDLRIHYTDGESAEYRPTKKGITIKPNISQQVIDAIFEASNQIIAEQNKS